MSMLPPGIALHNPCDIERDGDVFRYDGEVVPSSHAVLREFASDAWGMRACLVDFATYIVRDGVRTLGAAMERYAPPGENDTVAYTAAVCGACRASADTPFTEAWLRANAVELLDTITLREVGVIYPTTTVASAIGLMWETE